MNAKKGRFDRLASEMQGVSDPIQTVKKILRVGDVDDRNRRESLGEKYAGIQQSV